MVGLLFFVWLFYPICPSLQLTNGAVNPTTWSNSNVQIVGWFVVGIFHPDVEKGH